MTKAYEDYMVLHLGKESGVTEARLRVDEKIAAFESYVEQSKRERDARKNKRRASTVDLTNEHGDGKRHRSTVSYLDDDCNYSDDGAEAVSFYSSAANDQVNQESGCSRRHSTNSGAKYGSKRSVLGHDNAFDYSQVQSHLDSTVEKLFDRMDQKFTERIHTGICAAVESQLRPLEESFSKRIDERVTEAVHSQLGSIKDSFSNRMELWTEKIMTGSKVQQDQVQAVTDHMTSTMNQWERRMTAMESRLSIPPPRNDSSSRFIDLSSEREIDPSRQSWDRRFSRIEEHLRAQANQQQAHEEVLEKIVHRLPPRPPTQTPTPPALQQHSLFASPASRMSNLTSVYGSPHIVSHLTSYFQNEDLQEKLNRRQALMANCFGV